jgi:hypothetical protein
MIPCLESLRLVPGDLHRTCRIGREKTGQTNNCDTLHGHSPCSQMSRAPTLCCPSYFPACFLRRVSSSFSGGLFARISRNWVR